MTPTTRHLAKSLQGAISILLIAFVVTRAGPSFIMEKMSEIPPMLLLTGFAIVMIQTVIAALRWQKVLKNLAINLSRREVMRAYFSSMFFNQLLPASLGGDMFKFIRVHRAGSTKNSAFVAVLSERILSLLSNLLLMVPALVVSVKIGRNEIFYFSVFAAASVTLAVGLLLAVNKYHINRSSLSFLRPLISVAVTLKAQLTDWRLSLAVISQSLVIQTLTVLYILMMVYSLELDPNLAMVAVIVPFIFLAASIPLSLGGWGIREGAMVYGLSLANVGTSTALAVSITLGFHILMIGVVGGIVWLYDRQTIDSRSAIF